MMILRGDNFFLVCIIMNVLSFYFHVELKLCAYVFLDYSVKSYNSQASNGKEWKGVLRDWLNLLKSMRNPKSFYQSRFLKEVLEYRLVKFDVNIFWSLIFLVRHFLTFYL